MPFTQGVDLQAGGFRTTGGEVGDLLVSLKRLIYQGDSLAIASGLGLTVPVGSGVHVFNNNIRLEIENDALHIHPYIALTTISRDRWFYHGFLQLDVPMNGNDVFATVGGNTQQLVFDEIPLVHVDVSAGFWLFRSPGCLCGTCQTGYEVAAVAELHYTSSFQDQSTLMFQLGELRADQFSVLNVTFGLHTELGSGTVLRLGSVFPLGTGTTRLFDAEFQATLTQRF
ncbi:MAG: hypothetical protein IH991_23590 [Planctomycetes bacterium]|nr:hypothetical protein [Planctomycetota bacterium]